MLRASEFTGVALRKTRRPRRYVDSRLLRLALPLFRYSLTRDAYVLRGIGQRAGPVLRVDRRRGSRDYQGPERRLAANRG